MEKVETLNNEALEALNDLSIKNGRDPRSDAFLYETKELLEILVNYSTDWNMLTKSIYEELEKRYLEGFEDGETMFKDKMESISNESIEELGEKIAKELLLIETKKKYLTINGKKTGNEIGKLILNLTANSIRGNL